MSSGREFYQAGARWPQFKFAFIYLNDIYLKLSLLSYRNSVGRIHQLHFADRGVFFQQAFCCLFMPVKSSAITGMKSLDITQWNFVEKLDLQVSQAQFTALGLIYGLWSVYMILCFGNKGFIPVYSAISVSLSTYQRYISSYLIGDLSQVISYSIVCCNLELTIQN